MVTGGKGAARAAEGIIAAAAKKVMPHVAEDALQAGAKDAAKDAARAGAKDAAKTGGRDAAKAGARDAGRSAGRKGGRDAGRRAARGSARDGARGGRNSARDVASRTKTTDPIDVASGEVIFHQVDVELPGVLPLVLERTHVSSYRAGRWFGPSWSSTLDQRLEIDEFGVCLVGVEGMIMTYPIPMLGDVALPEWGPRWPLAMGQDGCSVTNPQDGRTLHFAARPNAGAEGVRATALPLTAIVDRGGDRIDLDYDGEGALAAIRHSGGYRIAVDTADGRITALRLADGEGEVPLRRYRYDDAGRLVAMIGPPDRPFHFAYDPAGRLTRWEDTNGHWYRYTYDERGRGVAGEGPDGVLAVGLAYHDGVTVVTDSLGNATTYHLNDLGQVVAEVDPLGGTTRSDWDPYDRLLERVDALGRTTRYAYDEHGNRVTAVRADGTRISTTYNALSLPVEVTDADGGVWRQRYDEAGRLVAVTDPLAATTSYTYDDRGHLAGVRDALGGQTVVRTDAAGLPVSVTDPLGHETRYVRDAFGRVTSITDPLGGTTRFGWTVDGRPEWRTLPDGATERWSYDGEGNQVRHVDALGHVTATGFGPFDVPVAETRPDGTRLEFGYDSELRLVSVTDPRGLVWRYEYDAAGNPVRESDFNGRTIAYAYDPAGQLIARTNGLGQTTGFARDALGNVVEQRSSDEVATFAYDAAGRLVRAVNPDADVRIERDAVGRVTAETCNGRTIGSSYDPLGRRVRRRTPAGAESLWSYDAAGQPVTLRTGGTMIGFEHDPLGREIQRRIGAGAILVQQWDPGDRLAAQTVWGAPIPAQAGPHGPGAPARLLQHRTYTYGADGNLTGIGDRLNGHRRLELDSAARVTAVHAEGWNEQYVYDGAGNLVHATWPGPTGPAGPGPEADAAGGREYTGTLIRRAGHVRYEHDRQGRVVLRQHARLSSRPSTWHYRWDADDRLREVLTPGGRRWYYRYDALGRRIAKQCLAPGGRGVVEQTDFTWDQGVLAERTQQVWSAADGAFLARGTVWEYEPDGYRPLTQLERVPARDAPQGWIDRRFNAIVTDLVGTPAELVDASGAVAWHRGATLWGGDLALPRDREEVSCPLRFPGQYFDPETGLNYNVHRYYDSAAARYLSADPIGLSAGPDLHGYVRNPTAWTDPLGLKGVPTGEEKTTVYHYTNKKSYDKIRSQSPYHLKPGESKNGPGPFVTTRSPAELTEPNAYKKLGLTNEKSQYVMQAEVPKSALKPLPGGRGDFIFSVPGGIRIPREDVKYFGPTSGWSAS